MLSRIVVKLLAPGQPLLAVERLDGTVDQVEIHAGPIREQCGRRHRALRIRFQRAGNRHGLRQESAEPVRIQVGRLVARISPVRVNLYGEHARGRVLDLLERAVAEIELHVATLYGR